MPTVEFRPCLHFHTTLETVRPMRIDGQKSFTQKYGQGRI